MVVNCEIQFDNNPQGIFFAGQALTGSITLTADKEKNVKGVALKIQGFAHTSWSESESRSTTDANGKSTSESTTVWYSGHEDYLSSTTFLLGSTGGPGQTIAPGIHTYNFACQLPLNCPSSFEGINGHIRYLVKVSLVRPWKWDQTYTKGFTVLKTMDLNYDTPVLRIPTSAATEKVYCCGPCKTDPQKILVNLPQSGFVPGQKIPVSVLVTNDSSIKVHQMQVRLVMEVICTSQSPSTKTNTENTKVTEIFGDPVLRNTKKLFNFEVPVPATPPTCNTLCRIIQINYQIQVVAKVKGCRMSQVVNVPITIGSVPLMSVVQQQPRRFHGAERQLMIVSPAVVEDMETTDAVVKTKADEAINANGSNEAQTSNQAGLSNVATSSPKPWELDANIPPPNYEQAMHMKTGKIAEGEPHDYGQVDFAPQYPVFNIPSPTAPTADEIDGGFRNGNTSSNNGTWL